MTTILFENPIFLEHKVPEDHPERPDRLKALNIALEHERFSPLLRLEAPQGNEDLVLLAHPEEHLRTIMSIIPEEGINSFEADTHASPASLQAALTGIGGAVAAVDAVFSGKADNVFVASRPPGHHAERNKAMGFCFFNNIAIAARHAQQKHGAERVAIIDWDVHHGNGTQDIFWDDPSVLFCSTHQMPLYPGSGAKTETGAGSRRLPSGFHPDLRRLRRPSPRPPGANQPRRQRFRLGDGPASRCRRQDRQQPHRQPARRRLRSSRAGRIGRHPHLPPDERMTMTTTAQIDVSSLSFEKAVEELESIVSALERGDVALDKSIEIYERGEALKKHCEALLNTAENRIEKIRLDRAGKPQGVEPLDGE
jgi:exodeoxyribonuclease VII small subunit